MSFRGASAEAMAALTGELEAVIAGGADATRIGDDLFSVSRVLRTEPSLRRVATDVSVATEAKQGLVRQLFEGKVDPASLAIVTAAVGRRWTGTRDLADGLERLSEVAIVRSAGPDSGRLADELFAFGRAVNDSPELRDALANPARSAADKAALVRDLIGDRALPATVALAQQSLAGTYRTVSTALETYQQVAAEVHGQGVATVRVARQLSAADHDRLEAALTRQYGRAVHLNVVVDPEVIGGIKVEIGDDVIDGTVANRLADAQRRLAG